MVASYNRMKRAVWVLAVAGLAAAGCGNDADALAGEEGTRAAEAAQDALEAQRAWMQQLQQQARQQPATPSQQP